MIKKHSYYLIGVKHLAFALLCMPLLSFSTQAVDAPPRIWSRVGPEGADINQLVISPSHPNTLYAATNPSSYYSSSNNFILKSLNGGDSWVTLPWQGKTFGAEPIVSNRTHQFYSSDYFKSPWQSRSLAVDSNNPDIVFTSLSGFLLKTSDSGMSWRPIGADISLNATSFFIINPSTTSSLNALVSSGNKIVSSDDGGEHWALSNQHIQTQLQQPTLEPARSYPAGESTIHLLRVDPENKAVLYGYTTVRHRGALAPEPVLLYKSNDSGKSWLNITPSGYRYLGSDLVFSPDNSQLVFSVFAKLKQDSFIDKVDKDVVMKSDNGGGTWQALGIPSKNTTKYGVSYVYVDSVDKNTLYANISPDKDALPKDKQVIAKSIDLGQSWNVIDLSPYFPGTLVIDPKNNKKLLMTSKQGILRSNDGGLKWNLSNQGIQHIGGKLSVAQDNSQVMYLTGNDPGSIVDSDVKRGFYYKTVNGGKDWNTFNIPNTVVTGYCHEFKINPKDNQDIFCLTNENIYQSRDGGKQWTFLKKSTSRQLVRANDGLSIYLSDTTGTSASVDNGRSWQAISTIYEGELTLHPQNQATLYYVLDGQLYLSTDSGKKWLKQETPNNISFNHLLIHPLNSKVMALYGTYGYALTDDGGNSWRTVLETLNNGNAEINSFPAEFNFISQLVLHPADPDSVFVKTNTGIYQSSDQGKQWVKRDSGIESYISSSYIDLDLLTSSKDVYLESSSGIFKLTDKVNTAAISECIFGWAEKEKANLYAPAPVKSQRWNGYTFRYYSKTKSYLGIFHEQEIHQLQTDVSNTVIPQGSIASYQKLSGCTDKPL